MLFAFLQLYTVLNIGQTFLYMYLIEKTTITIVNCTSCCHWSSLQQVMDNLLVQVTGRKKVVLFSPREAGNLYLSGDKSRVLDIDSPNLSTFPRFSRVTCHECHLEPGDVLFIPALWFHNVVSLDFGVAVNVFWKNLDENLYDSRDTYGNKDPLPAQRAQQILDRALKALEELPDNYRDFYARRLVSRIEEKSYTVEPS